MKYTRITVRNLIPQSIIWGCNYSHTSTEKAMHYCAKPVKGMITVANSKAKEEKIFHDNSLQYSRQTAGFFVPFKKNAHGTTLDDLAWSKAVTIEARLYADTEDEAIELYNNKVIATVKQMLNIAKNDANEIININLSDKDRQLYNAILKLDTE